MRLFVAIDLPEPVKERLALLCCGLPGARWVDPDQIHLTLRFIGEVDGGLFLDIRDVLAAIEGDCLFLQLSGIGFFPPRGKPRVIWVGLRENKPLQKLRNRIESRLVDLGLEPEGRKFSPHITLARLKNTPTIKIVRFLEAHSDFRSNPFPVDSFHLYSSILGRKGAIHCIEVSYPLTENDYAPTNYDVGRK